MDSIPALYRPEYATYAMLRHPIRVPNKAEMLGKHIAYEFRLTTDLNRLYIRWKAI